MAKDNSNNPEERKPKVWCGMKITTWIQLFNVLIGVAIVLFSVFSFFTIPIGDGQMVVAYSFKVYEM